MRRRRCIVAVPLALVLVACAVPEEQAPAATTGPIRIAVKGDWGSGRAAQAAVTKQMCATRTEKPFRIVATTGDNFYKPDGVATDTNYYTPEACLIAPDSHRWRASWGNHDVRGDSTRTVLGARRYYKWTAGNADFFMLDSNRVTSSTQRAWLRDRLRESTAAVKIVMFHHPPYTVGSHLPNKAVRENWVPLFERYGVKLVLNGHNHLYEHHKRRGIHYVVTGGGGARLYPCERTASTLIKCRSRYHFLLVYVSSSRVVVRAVRPSGETLDYFRFFH